MWLHTTTDRSCGKKLQRQIMWLEATTTDPVVRVMWLETTTTDHVVKSSIQCTICALF